MEDRSSLQQKTNYANHCFLTLRRNRASSKTTLDATVRLTAQFLLPWNTCELKLIERPESAESITEACDGRIGICHVLHACIWI